VPVTIRTPSTVSIAALSYSHTGLVDNWKLPEGLTLPIQLWFSENTRQVNSNASSNRLRGALDDHEYRATVTLKWFRDLARTQTPIAAVVFDDILREIGLDDERVAELKVQPFPF
jgi:hypothetical protein